jgi:hypothetical protein
MMDGLMLFNEIPNDYRCCQIAFGHLAASEGRTDGKILDRNLKEAPYSHLVVKLFCKQ